VKNAIYEAPYYTVFTTLLLSPLSWVQIFSTQSSEVLSVCVEKPYKIAVQHILIFIFLCRKWEGKIF
jgi:hypothetical protein